MSAIIIPYSKRAESFCPKCNTLHTIYWPELMMGRCEDCGFEWRFQSVPTRHLSNGKER